MPVLEKHWRRRKPVTDRQLLSLNQSSVKMPSATVDRYFSGIELNVS